MAIIKQLDGGAKFEELAKENTTDPSGKTTGGDLGYFGPGQMVPEFEKAAFALEIGAYTKEPVQTQFGWHVIKVEDKRAQQPPAFEQVKDQVRLVFREKYFALVSDLRKRPRSTSPIPTEEGGRRDGARDVRAQGRRPLDGPAHACRQRAARCTASDRRRRHGPIGARRCSALSPATRQVVADATRR